MRHTNNKELSEAEISKRRKERIFQKPTQPGNLGNSSLSATSPSSPLQQAQNVMNAVNEPRLSTMFRDSGTEFGRDSMQTTTTFVPRPESEDNKEKDKIFEERPVDTPILRISMSEVNEVKKKKKTGGIFTIKRKPKRKPLKQIEMKKSPSTVSAHSGSKLLAVQQRESANTMGSSTPAIDDARSSMTPENRSSNRDAPVPTVLHPPPVISKRKQSYMMESQRPKNEKRNKLPFIAFVLFVFALGIGIGIVIGQQSAPTDTVTVFVTLTETPTLSPTVPTVSPTNQPTTDPTLQPSISPTTGPTLQPSISPTTPTLQPSISPTTEPTVQPTENPTA